MSYINLINNAPFAQNNVPQSIDYGTISFVDYTTNLDAAILNRINATGLNISDISIPILEFEISIDAGTETIIRKYQVNVGKGFYGNGLDPYGLPRTALTLANLILVFDSGNANNTFTGQDNISKTITINSGDLSGIGTIEEQIAAYVNSLNYLKTETTSDIWILTDEDEETSLPLHYAPVSRSGTSGTYTINNNDDKKFITIDASVTNIELANNLVAEFDCYLLNPTTVTKTIGTVVASTIANKYNRILLNGGVIRITKDFTSANVITGDLEIDFSKINQIEFASNITTITLNNDYHGKELLVNSSVNSIIIYINNTLKNNFKTDITQIGTNDITFVNLTGVTIVSKSGYKITGQYSKCSIQKRNSLTNTFILTGEIKL